MKNWRKKSRKPTIGGSNNPKTYMGITWGVIAITTVTIALCLAANATNPANTVPREADSETIQPSGPKPMAPRVEAIVNDLVNRGRTSNPSVEIANRAAAGFDPVPDPTQGKQFTGLASEKIRAGNKAIEQLVAQTGGANNSQLVYDSFGHCVQIVETRNGSVASTKQFVWNADELSEERDSSGNVTKQFFTYGQTIGGTPYYYTRDQINSVREMTDSSGNLVAQYSYTPDGRGTKVKGNTVDSDFLYAGMYDHQPSSFNLAVHRAYNPSLGRWMSRDPIGERGGLNLFAYVGNNPVKFRDPMGLLAQCQQSCEEKCKPFQYNLYRYSQCMDLCEQEGTPKFNDCNAHASCEPLWGPPYSSPPWVDCMHHCLAGTTPPKPGKLAVAINSPGAHEIVVTPPRF
jgi:RHS repeat-associated protein